MNPKKIMYIPEEDGLVSSTVGGWSEVKYRLVSLYATLFSTGMKNKWDTRIYIDLYSGAGVSRVEGTGKLVAGSPLLALTVDDPFDAYIFCEKDAEKLNALAQRSKRIAPQADVRYVHGDCNERVDQIVRELPVPRSDKKVLALCFADPFDISVRFNTIKKLAQRFTDFLVLLAVYMDANRNYSKYLSADSDKVDNFLGSNSWRAKWQQEQDKALRGERPLEFPHFLADEFSASMQRIGYRETPRHTMKLVRSDEKNLPLYYLAFFSKHALGYEFWQDVLKYGTDQTSFEY